jgi:phage gp29-like protein
MNGSSNNGNGQKYGRGESFSTAALMNKNADHVFDAPGGIAFRLNPDGYGKTSTAEKDRVASFVNEWLEKDKDPAAGVFGASPLFGQDAVPHAMTFASKIGSQAKTYLPSDESLEANPNDALLMRKDLGIMECLEIRQRMTALLDWSIVPGNSKSPAQKSVAAELTKIIGEIRRFTEYRRCLMDAIWIGRSAIQHTYDKKELIDGKQYCYPQSEHADSIGWTHIHGDKVVFRYDDGEKMPPGAFPGQMGVRVSPIIKKDSRIRGIESIEYTNSGAALFIPPYVRRTIICHKHMIEDAEYQNPRKAGRIHGVGIRDRIYNEWFLKQEILGFLMEYMERSAGGIEIYEYPSGDEAAKRSVMEAAKNRMAFGRNQIFFPKPLGMDSAVYDLRIVEPGFAGMDMLLNIQDKYFGHRIKRYIIGQTLSTEADATGLGSSVADFQKDSLAQIVMYDSNNLQETITHELVRTIQLANWPETEGWRFKFKHELESDNVKEKLDGYRTAWEMGLGIPEKDVSEAIGVSLDNPNEKILRNAAAGAAPGMANGMQFPAGTGFGNQIDAAHEHVKAAGEVRGLKDGVIDHVAGKIGEGGGGAGGGESGPPSSPAVNQDQYQRRSSRLLSEAASETHTSPTPAQREAGNYAKGIFPWKGLEIAIENPKGSVRTKTSPSSGREWSRTMASHYGYFRRTSANDGDNLDVFIGNHPDSDFVLVIKQVDQDGEFDEFKVVVGCLNRKEARKLYLANYPAGWKCGPAASMTVDLFKKWVANGGPMRAKSLAKTEC